MTATVLKLPQPPVVPREIRPRLRTALDWLRARLDEDRERWVLWLPACLALGISAYFALPAEPPVIVTMLFGSVAIAGAFALPEAWRRLPLVIAACLVAGFLAGQIRTRLVDAPRIAAPSDTVTVTGRILWAEPTAAGKWRILLDTVAVEGWAADETPARVRLTGAIDLQSAGPLVGRRVSLKTRLMPPQSAIAPGAYEFSIPAYFQRVGATGYYMSDLRFLDAGAAPAFGFAGLRRAISDRFAAHLPPHTAGLASALIVGARGGIAEDDLAALRNAGLAHMLAISGLHLGLVSGIVFFFVRGGLALIEPLALAWPLKKIAAVAALIAAAFYLGVSGASVSTQRSFIMLTVALAAILVDRPAITLRSVALAAGVLLLWQPESLWQPGFQMSFGAVTALVAAYEWMSRRATARERGPARAVSRYVLGLALTTLVAEAATAPFGIYHFNVAVTYGLVGNEAAMPLLGFWVMPMAVAGVAAMPFGLEAWPLQAMGWGIEQMLAAAHWTASLPGAVRYVPPWPDLSLLLVVFGGLWLCLWTAALRLAGLVFIAAGLVFTAAGAPPTLVVGPKPGQIAAVVPAADPKGGKAVMLFGAREGSFRSDVLAKRFGIDPDTVSRGTKTAPCDDLGCVFRTVDGTRIALVRDGRALAEECLEPGILVSEVVVAVPCLAPALVIDPGYLAAHGTVALSTRSNRVRQHADGIGTRPWSAPAAFQAPSQ